MTFSPPRCQSKDAFTLIETLTTVAVLVIVLALMVELAQQVRNQSAIQLTRELLGKLDGLMSQYTQRTFGEYPQVTPLFEAGASPTEAQIRQAARVNNGQFIAALRSQENLAGGQFGGLSIAYYDDLTLRDAWGSPIVFLPPGAPNPGISPLDRAFFVSAGPDRSFLTRDDNLYSYEIVR